jgi:lipopolysaccharide/colanic/teichoic acid biosynthesis glycosyltransferase
MSKRLFDLVVGVLGLIVLSPVLLALALAVKLTSPGPLFYRAARVGKGGQPFKLYKFRSMVINADKIGAGVTRAQDPRVTSIGRILRGYKLDELPQLINVVAGTMSFVGPRPEDPRYVALYTPEQRRVLSVRPGITSLASVTYRDEESILVGDDWEQKYIHEVMPAKLTLDLRYIDEQSLALDISIILRTLRAI